MTHPTIPVRKLAWGTDWHLNFLKPPERQEFIERVSRTDADALCHHR